MPRSPTHIRDWRQHRHLSLRQLADRINGGRPTPLISYASLARIECGRQPYSQDILEAIAQALGVEPAQLLCGEPGVCEQMWNLWPRLTGEQRRLTIAIIQTVLLGGEFTRNG